MQLGPHQQVRRVLPNRDRQMIGAWCFLDHYGPEDISAERGMWVPPHPHTGLQTASWLFAGEIRHRDRLGSDVLLRPGALNLMTAGVGIAHSEASPTDHPATLHALQLWVALPSPARDEAPRAFTQYAGLPMLERPGLEMRVVMGALAGVGSAVPSHTPVVGAELRLRGAAELPLEAGFEHGVLAVDGDIVVEGADLRPSEFCYLGGGRDLVRLHGSGRAFLLGGAPFEEQLVMWWHFVGGTHEEIVVAREAWNAGAGERFGRVDGFPDNRLIALPMPTVQLKPRGRHR